MRQLIAEIRQPSARLSGSTTHEWMWKGLPDSIRRPLTEAAFISQLRASVMHLARSEGSSPTQTSPQVRDVMLRVRQAHQLLRLPTHAPQRVHSFRHQPPPAVHRLIEAAPKVSGRSGMGHARSCSPSYGFGKRCPPPTVDHTARIARTLSIKMLDLAFLRNRPPAHLLVSDPPSGWTFAPAEASPRPNQTASQPAATPGGLSELRELLVELQQLVGPGRNKPLENLLRMLRRAAMSDPVAQASGRREGGAPRPVRPASLPARHLPFRGLVYQLELPESESVRSLIDRLAQRVRVTVERPAESVLLLKVQWPPHPTPAPERANRQDAAASQMASHHPGARATVAERRHQGDAPIPINREPGAPPPGRPHLASPRLGPADMQDPARLADWLRITSEPTTGSPRAEFAPRYEHPLVHPPFLLDHPMMATFVAWIERERPSAGAEDDLSKFVPAGIPPRLLLEERPIEVIEADPVLDEIDAVAEPAVIDVTSLETDPP